MKKLSLVSIALCGSLIFGGIGSTAFGEQLTETDSLEVNLASYPIEKEKPKANQGLTGRHSVKTSIECANGLKEYYAIKEAEEEAKRIAEEMASASKRQKSSRSYSGGSSNYTSGGSGVLTRSGGVNYFGGRRETWYSTNEPGQTVTAKPIPGRNVGSDGVIRDAEGYVCVATHQSDYKFGEVIDTSFGPGKVYDTGCARGTTDIYTTW